MGEAHGNIVCVDCGRSDFVLRMLTLSVRYFGMKTTRPGKRPVVLVGHMTADVALKVFEENEPEFARQVVVGKRLLLRWKYVRSFILEARKLWDDIPSSRNCYSLAYGSSKTVVSSRSRQELRQSCSGRGKPTPWPLPLVHLAMRSSGRSKTGVANLRKKI